MSFRKKKLPTTIVADEKEDLNIKSVNEESEEELEELEDDSSSTSSTGSFQYKYQTSTTSSEDEE